MNYLSLDYYLQRARSSVRTSKSIGRFLVSGASRHESYLKINAHSEPGYNSPSMCVCKSYHGTSRGLAKYARLASCEFLKRFYIPLSAAHRRATREHRIIFTLEDQNCTSRGCRPVYLNAGMEYIRWFYTFCAPLTRWAKMRPIWHP